ncbi:MAG: glycosyltransferase [Verrucomicrobiales bacterium]|nr:glycosyltransferase [Verrucomicrobiales bacterium]
MIERFFLIFWGCWLLLVLFAAIRVFAFSFARRRQDKRWGDGTKDHKPAVVIVPVKGFDVQSSPRFFDTLFDQDYSNYRVIVTFEAWHDPVAVWLKEELEVTGDSPLWCHPEENSSLKSITLVCAGVSENEGQKVHNQRAAFKHLTDSDEIIAFADADIVFKSNWLAKLVAPINQTTHPLSTTYRWLVPKRPTLPNQIASVINASITTQGGWESTNVLWGGSMAVARSVFNSLDVPQLLKGSLNDDLRLSKAARAAGNRVAFVRSLILPTLIDFSWSDFFEFAKRQYTQVKFFSPILYRGTNFVLGFYALGLLSLLGALIYGYFLAWIPIAAAYIIDQFRSLARQQIYLSLFSENGIQRKLFSASWLEHMLTPFWMLLHWLLLVSTWTQSKITWAGISYRIIAKDKTRILNRPVVAERLPVGVPGLALIAALNDRNRGSYTQPIRPVSTAPITPTPQTLAPPIGKAAAVETSASEAIVAPGPMSAREVLEKAAGAATTSDHPTPDKVEAPPAAPTPAPAPSLSHPGVSPFVTPLTALARPLRSWRSQTKEQASPKKYLAGSLAPSRPRKKEDRERTPAHLIQVHFHPTNPNLAESRPPSGLPSTEPSLVESTPDVTGNEEPLLPITAVTTHESTPLSFPGESKSAHRAHFRRSRSMGYVGQRKAKSSRVNDVSYCSKGQRTFHPVSKSPAGRSS